MANKRTVKKFSFALISGLLLGTLLILPETALAQSDPVFVGAGDISACSHDRDESTAKLLDGIAGTVVTMGDNVYSSGTTDEFNNCYAPTWGRHKGRTQPSPGNHDYNTAGATGYYTYFGAAASPLDTNCTSNCKGYYSYNLGAWHVIALNSETASGAGSAQEQWLRADLAANQNTCTLAYWHKPRFSSGQHGNNSGSQSLWQALYDFGADVVLNGHDHTYERFAPQSPTGQAQPTRGIREFVAGTGGASLYSFPTIQPNSEVRNNTTWGVLKLTLHPISYDWEFVPIAGQTFTDVGSANCVSLGPTPTPTSTPSPGPSPTATASLTPTSTLTYTPTLTPTDTQSPTDTPAPTLTHTPGSSPTSTETPTPTQTPVPPTDTPTRTATPLPGEAPAVGAVSSGTTAGSSLTLSHTSSGHDRLMLVGVSINNDNLETVSSVTYNGAPLTFVGAVSHQGSGGDDSRVEIWKLLGPPEGTYEVVITFSADLLHYAVAGVITFTGVNQANPLGTFASNYATSASASVTVPSGSGELVLGVFSCETCSSLSFAPPGVGRWGLAAGGGNTIGAGATIEGTGAQVTLSASLGSGDHWAMGGVSIRPGSSGIPTPSPSATPIPNETFTPTATRTPTWTPTPSITPLPAVGVIYLSSTSSGTIGGISFADEDILAFNTAAGTWSMVFDGSDVGLGSTDVDAFSLLPDGTIVMSIDSSTYTISGFGTIEDRDIVRFIHTALGPTTAGTFEWYFDGSDVELTTNAEDIDAIDFAPDDRLLLSTVGSFGVTGASGTDEDLVAFTKTTLGANTSGTWELYFDGSDVGLSTSSSEDVGGVWVDGPTGEIYLSTLGAFTVTGLSGTGADIFICTPSQVGSTTSCAFRTYWVASNFGWGGEVTDGIQVAKP